MKILDLGEDERPVEKLLSKGSSVLSNVELIAILLRSGTGSMNAMDTARALLAKAEGKLTLLSGMSSEKMTSVPGIGAKKAAAVAAAFELGRRFMEESAGIDKTAVTDPSAIFRIMHPLLKGLEHEECWIIYMNRANYIIGKEMLSSGGFSSTTIDRKMAVLKAMEKKASGVILVHNHPSGNPKPGQADTRETSLLKKALDAVDISLLDHIIVCNDCYFSFSDGKARSR